MCIVLKMGKTLTDFGQTVAINRGVFYTRLLTSDEFVAQNFQNNLSRDQILSIAQTHENQAASLMEACQ